jgi:SAM-dependent methyltransferase
MIPAVDNSVEWMLADHYASMARLKAVISRVGSKLDPESFIETVASTFQEVQDAANNFAAASDLRSDSSFVLFQKALTLAAAKMPNPSILVLGCGRGFPGKPAAVAVEAVKEVFSASVTSLNLTPSMLRREPVPLPQKYDLVVAYSVLHFIPDLNAFFDLVCGALKPSGGLILGHEPNARFWKNRDCRAAISRLRSRRNWRRKIGSLDPRRLFRKAPAQPTIWERVNRILQQSYGFTAPLSENELRRLVDVHRPEANPGDFRIGFNGFDPDELRRAYLPGFRQAWIGTADHLGYNPIHLLSEDWQRTEKLLAGRHPLDGCVFTGYWTRQGNA